MSSAAAIRLQIEAALANRIPSALTPAPRLVHPVERTGITEVDALLDGGLPLGAMTEIAGPECSGRTSLALSFLSRMTRAGKICAWVDVSDTFDPESAAAESVDLSRLLWIRCGVASSIYAPQTGASDFVLPEKYLAPPPVKKGLHGGGFGPHPRNEGKGLPGAVSSLLSPETIAARCAEPRPRTRQEREAFEPKRFQQRSHKAKPISPAKPWSRIEQALRVTDLIVQAGGFSAIVLDMGGIAPEYASRTPLATWFRYRAAAEKSQAVILLLTQHACAKSAAEVILRLQPGILLREEKTVFTGVEYRAEVAQRRFEPSSTSPIPLRKPPQRATEASWRCRNAGAGPR